MAIPSRQLTNDIINLELKADVHMCIQQITRKRRHIQKQNIQRLHFNINNVRRLVLQLSASTHVLNKNISVSWNSRGLKDLIITNYSNIVHHYFYIPEILLLDISRTMMPLTHE